MALAPWNPQPQVRASQTLALVPGFGGGDSEVGPGAPPFAAPGRAGSGCRQLRGRLGDSGKVTKLRVCVCRGGPRPSSAAGRGARDPAGPRKGAGRPQ